MAHEHLQRKKIINPLSGRELAEMIVREIKSSLENHGYFRNNLTYPNVHFRWVLDVRSYPNEPPAFQVEVEQQMNVPGWKENQLEAPTEEHFESEQEIKRPETAREQLQEGAPSQPALSSREDDPDSDAFRPKGGRMIRVKTP
jgi:hypothetical protein